MNVSNGLTTSLSAGMISFFIYTVWGKGAAGVEWFKAQVSDRW